MTSCLSLAGEVKEFARGLGADAVGVASVEVLNAHPPDAAVPQTPDRIWPEARSCVAFIRRIPAGAFDAVDASSLMIDPNSGLARGANGVALETGWHSRWHSQSDYLVMSPGQVANFWIKFTNTGTETWNRGIWGRQANLGLNGDDKAPYRLGMAANWLWDDRIATTIVPVVSPGEIGEFRFNVRAPMARGTYRLNLRPVIDGTVWMEDQGVFWLIVVP